MVSKTNLTTFSFRKDVLKTFVTNVIYGVEATYYNQTLNNKSVDDDKKWTEYMSIPGICKGHKLLESYFLELTKDKHDPNDTEGKNLVELISCILCNNTYKVGDEEKMHISYDYLLNIITNISCQIYEKLPRSKLQIADLEALKVSLNSIFEIMSKYMDYSISSITDQVETKINSEQI